MWLVFKTSDSIFCDVLKDKFTRFCHLNHMYEPYLPKKPYPQFMSSFMVKHEICNLTHSLRNF